MSVNVFSSSSSVLLSPLASNTWYGLRTHQLQAGQVYWRCHARQLRADSLLFLTDLLHSWPLLAPAVFKMKKLLIFSAARAHPCRRDPPLWRLFLLLPQLCSTRRLIVVPPPRHQPPLPQLPLQLLVRQLPLQLLVSQLPLQLLVRQLLPVLPSLHSPTNQQRN